jgi:sec-independent protein translocase protein TatA
LTGFTLETNGADMSTNTLAFLGHLGGWEILILAALGLLIFGRRLPEVGRSLGKGIVEFKKGLQGVEDEIDKAADERPKAQLDDPSQSHNLDADIDHTAEPAATTHGKAGA